MNVLIWATTFGADLWSLARHLDARDDCRVRVVMERPDVFAREGVAHLYPLAEPPLRRRLIHRLGVIPGFRPDVTITDNRLPLRAASPAGMMLWHGFGWKGPDDERTFAWMHRAIRNAFGDAKQPNGRFIWQTFGPADFEHRTRVSGFHPSNCRQIGAVSHDHLRTPIDRALAQPYYPFDVQSRPTVLLAPTWHYGEVFAHWGTDAALFETLLAHLRQRGANVILRLHDSFRFDKPYRAFLDGLAARHPHVLLKYKDRNPDNFLDLQVADVLVTNFSSIANLFYATGRPTVHMYPVRHADEAFMTRQLTVFGVRKQEIPAARFIWKLPPEENGGLLARSFDELVAMIDQGLDDPACCRQRAAAFLDTHMLGADGRNGERAWSALQELASGG
jgi:hypothetical protein